MQQKKEDIGGIDGDSSNVLFELRKTLSSLGNSIANRQERVDFQK